MFGSEKRSKISQIIVISFACCYACYFFMSPHQTGIQTLISGDINFFPSHSKSEILEGEPCLFTNAGHKRNWAARLAKSKVPEWGMKSTLAKG